MITTIYCADGNPRFAQIAIEAGFAYGAQLPKTVYAPLYFADQNWKRPKRVAYINRLAKERPYMATVLDWERLEQLNEVLGWAEEAAQFVEEVLIIPKVSGGIKFLPRQIGGKPVRLAYSVHTRYGGTTVPLSEFAGWRIHLLGGSHIEQMAICREIGLARGIGRITAQVVSVDGNYHQKLAREHCQFWSPERVRHAKTQHWPTLREYDGRHWEQDGMYEAFRRSCENIMASWRRLEAGGIIA